MLFPANVGTFTAWAMQTVLFLLNRCDFCTTRSETPPAAWWFVFQLTPGAACVHCFVKLMASRRRSEALGAGSPGLSCLAVFLHLHIHVPDVLLPVQVSGWGAEPLSVPTTCCLTLWRLANMGSRSPPAGFSSVWYQQLVASLTSDWSYPFFF